MAAKNRKESGSYAEKVEQQWKWGVKTDGAKFELTKPFFDLEGISMRAGFCELDRIEVYVKYASA
jgi:hypothetical protein